MVRHRIAAVLLTALVNVSCSGAGGTAGIASTPTPPRPASGTITEYGNGLPPIGDITAGPDGALWFTEPSVNRIGRITTAGVVTEFAAGISPGAYPAAITNGPDGALWFTEPESSDPSGTLPQRIGRITTSGVVTEYSSGISVGAGLYDIVAGPDGALWFTEFLADKIGRITTSGVVTEFSNGTTPAPGSPPQPTDAEPTSITAGPDGALWYVENGVGGGLHMRLGRITPTGVITHFPIEMGNEGDIALGPDGALWTTNFTAGAPMYPELTRTTTSGAFTTYSTPSGFETLGIAAGPDGALWFTEYYPFPSPKAKLGRITTAGSVSEYSNGWSEGFFPGAITAGPDGGMWFSESGNANSTTGVYTAGKIGRIQP